MQREHSDQLSYASAWMPPWQRGLVRAIENASGRRRLLTIYERWRSEKAGRPAMMTEMLELIGTDLDIRGTWPVVVGGDEPLVMIANHPFGIGDGIALTVLAEALQRPYRILVNKDFLKVPEVRDIVLPIDFDETDVAVRTNLATRAEARRLLKQGVTIVIFPAGGVATAERLFGPAEELPWKLFTARLVQQAGASVLPVHFEGQNSRLFHVVSRYSLTLRLSLLVAEFRRFVGARVCLTVGDVIRFEELDHRSDRRALTDELHAHVQRLAPGNRDKPLAALRPRPPEARRRFPWDARKAPSGLPQGNDSVM
ncbi:MAG: lysophospholipid acyltransferase family protein [Hyphomicrobiaceae bacterium]|nr:lysophospholipid acyltransferase family protein [Hyphomicrobiaceae bacterium]